MTLSPQVTIDPLAVATDVAKEAGGLLMDFLHRPLHIREKSRRADLVTDADRAAEELIVQRLRHHFPRAAIIGEESGVHEGRSNECWYVDPLDGTTNYAHGYPIFCVSIAYERDGDLIAAVVYAPYYDELFCARRGNGATLNGKRISVSNITELRDAMVCTGFHPADFDRNGPTFRAVSYAAQAVRRDGSAALDLANVAAGRFDGFWEFDLHSWDVAAGALLISEAGGTVRGAKGAPLDVDGGFILATNGHIHEALAHTVEGG